MTLLKGRKVEIGETAVWKDAVGFTGKVTCVLDNISNSDDLYLVKFDSRKMNQLSSEYGGFTFKLEDLKILH
jgi:hypothetical protein